MPSLFQDEPDEKSPTLFQDEGSEQEDFLFQNERDEKVHSHGGDLPAAAVPAPVAAGGGLFRDEPDEPDVDLPPPAFWWWA